MDFNDASKIVAIILIKQTVFYPHNKRPAPLLYGKRTPIPQ
jgi:hypothetical protein